MLCDSQNLHGETEPGGGGEGIGVRDLQMIPEC